MTDGAEAGVVADEELQDLDALEGFAGDAAGSDDVDGNKAVAGVSRAVLEYLAKSIVDEPESVVVEIDDTVGGPSAVMLRLHVAPSDMGRVIGRRGRIAQAIRTVVRAAGAKEGIETDVDIVD